MTDDATRGTGRADRAPPSGRQSKKPRGTCAVTGEGHRPKELDRPSARR